MKNSSIPQGSLTSKTKTNKAFRLISLWLMVIVSLVFVSNNVLAIEYGGFGGRPAYPRADNPRTESIFVHTLEPGATQAEGLKAINNSAEPKTILVYATDSTPSSGGSFACKQLSQEKKDVGSWITLEKSEITLQPATNEIIPFTINVPANASVGEHNGCIVIQEKKEQVDDPEKSGASISVRTGLRVAIMVPGEIIRNLEVESFVVTSNKKGGVLLTPAIKNTGNVSIDADVAVVTRYFFGKELIKHGGNYPILREETADRNFELLKPFWGGLFRSSVTVEYDTSTDATVGVQSEGLLTKIQGPSVWFFTFPTLGGLAIELVVLLIIIFAIILLTSAKKRKKAVKTHWNNYEVKTGESIHEIAKRLNISWKLLAKANKTKPPYALKEGQKIKVPPTK